MKNKNRAFTLIELLVVISIIALLSSIVLSALNSARENARIASGMQFSSSVYHAAGAQAVGVWKFEEGSGTVANDFSGNGNNGAISGATWSTDTFHSTSKNSLDFSGTAYVQIANALGISNNDFTFTEWIKTSTGSGQMYTIGNAGSGNGYRFGLSGGRVAFLIGNGSFTETTCGTQTVNDNKWHHIAGVFDRTNLKFSCYIDGAFIASVTIAQYAGMSDTPGRIGKPVCCANFVGLLDDVAIYSQTLTVSQIREIYVRGLLRHTGLSDRRSVGVINV